jgi:RimK family alpha-L-glutamate ligase
MKMKGLIINNSFKIPKALEYKNARLTEEFLKMGVEMDSMTSMDLGLFMQDSRILLKRTEGYSFAVYLDKDEYAAKALESIMPIFNSADSIANCDDKFLTYMKLKDSGIPTPKTIPSSLCYSFEVPQDKIDKFVEYVESELSFPMVCKECYGSLGLQVYLIKNHQELSAIYRKLIGVPHLYQKYIETSYGKDFRIFTIGGKCVAYMERINKNDFRSNIALGGKGYLVEPPKGFIPLAEKASKILGLDYAGVDIMIDKDNKPTLAEVNSNAFLSEIEAVSKVNVTKLLVEHILAKLHLKQGLPLAPKETI